MSERRAKAKLEAEKLRGREMSFEDFRRARLNEVSKTKTLEAGVSIDALREDLRLYLLERAQGEFDNPRPHQYAYSNDLLDELVRIRPRTKNALRSINGMGPWRMESSEGILRIIDEWLMRRCVHSIQSNMELLAANPEGEVSVTPEVLDDISQHFVEWARGRDKSPKRISTVEAKQKILELMGGFSDSNGKLRVSELRGGLADRGMVLSPSRLSQIITSMVNDDLIVRKRPVRYEKGVVILEFTEKGLAESLQASRGVASRVRNLVREICVERGGKAHHDEIYSRAESTNIPETTVAAVIDRMLITGELSSTNDAQDVYQFPRQS
jgi:DNA-binding HxlR family transcriptional regulator